MFVVVGFDLMFLCCVFVLLCISFMFCFVLHVCCLCYGLMSLFRAFVLLCLASMFCCMLHV